MSNTSNIIKAIRNDIANNNSVDTDFLFGVLTKDAAQVDDIAVLAGRLLDQIDSVGLCDECFPRFPLSLMTELHRAIEQRKK